MRRSLTPLLFLSLLGCAARQHVERGDALAAQGDWSSALREYQVALEKRPKNDEFRDLVDSARGKALTDSLERAAEALDHGKFVDAHEALLESHELAGDFEEIDELDEKLGELIVKEGRRNLEANQLETAYGWAATVVAWYGERRDARQLLTDVGAAVQTRATSLIANKDWNGAHQMYGFIEAYEPYRRDEVAALQYDVDVRWADDLLIKAHAADKEHKPASAFLYAAQAAGLSRRAQDAVYRDQLRQTIVNDGGFDIAITGTGDGGVVQAIRSDLKRAFDNGVVRIDGSGAPDLTMTVDVPGCRFDNAKVTLVGEQNYLDGYTQAPNPLYESQRETTLRAEDAVVYAERTEREKRQGLREARGDLDRAEHALEPLVATYRDADDALRTAEAATTDLLQAMDAAERELAAARDAGYPLDDLQVKLRDARARYLTARTTEESAAARLRSAREPYDSARATVRTAEDRVAAREADVAQASATVAERREIHFAAAQNLAAIPPLIDQEHYSVFRYGVEDVTRTCTLNLSLALGKEADRVSTWANTVDRSHAAYIRYGVPEDPLWFPVDDGTLQATALSTALPTLEEKLSAKIGTWQADKLAVARATTSEETAAAAYTLVALSDVDHVPAGFDAWLDANRPGMKYEWLTTAR